MFGGDPFDPFGTRRQMRQMEQFMDNVMESHFGMMDSFMSNPFGMAMQPQHPMLGDGSNRQRSRGAEAHQRQLAHPFGGFSGFGMFGNLMNDMNVMSSQAMNTPNSTMFSQSTMISYDGNGAPRVVQNSVRKSGDVKETRHTIRDGGREEIRVGHAIGDREHIIEKKRDSDGRVRKNQKFVNLDEKDAETFNHEFKERSRNTVFGNNQEGSRHRAIDNGRGYPSSQAAAAGRSSAPAARSSAGTSQPIIEIPDDDDEEEEEQSNGRGRGRRGDEILYSNSGSGPRISEITDDDKGSSSKRRKGMFGRFFDNEE